MCNTTQLKRKLASNYTKKTINQQDETTTNQQKSFKKTFKKMNYTIAT